MSCVFLSVFGEERFQGLLGRLFVDAGVSWLSSVCCNLDGANDICQ
jgi:hypothetical protein